MESLTHSEERPIPAKATAFHSLARIIPAKAQAIYSPATGIPDMAEAVPTETRTHHAGQQTAIAMPGTNRSPLAKTHPRGMTDGSPGVEDPGNRAYHPPSRTLEGCQNRPMASTYHSLHVHIVFATHERTPTLDANWREELHAYIGGTLKGLGGTPLAVGGAADHIHLLAGLKTTHAVADLVREIKKASHDWIRERSDSFSWQVGYGAFSVSPGDLERTMAYILNQEEHHRKVSSADELRALLKEAGIEFDERFFE